MSSPTKSAFFVAAIFKMADDFLIYFFGFISLLKNVLASQRYTA